jgi:hypothetical protein
MVKNSVDFVTIGSLVLLVIIENQIFLINSCFDLGHFYRHCNCFRKKNVSSKIQEIRNLTTGSEATIGEPIMGVISSVLS